MRGSAVGWTGIGGTDASQYPAFVQPITSVDLPDDRPVDDHLDAAGIRIEDHFRA